TSTPAPGRSRSWTPRPTPTPTRDSAPPTTDAIRWAPPADPARRPVGRRPTPATHLAETPRAPFHPLHPGGTELSALRSGRLDGRGRDTGRCPMRPDERPGAPCPS